MNLANKKTLTPGAGGFIGSLLMENLWENCCSNHVFVNYKPLGVRIPARKIGSRFQESEINELLKLKWWDKSFEEIKSIADRFFKKSSEHVIE